MSRPECRRSEHQYMVEAFMRAAGQELPVEPTVPSYDVRKLRAKLIFEETLETIKALGFRVRAVGFDQYEFEASSSAKAIDICEVIDGCADLAVVTTGTLSAFGVPDSPFQKEVDHNNMLKFGPGGYRRADGKWIKPADHKPPHIKETLNRVIVELSCGASLP